MLRRIQKPEIRRGKSAAMMSLLAAYQSQSQNVLIPQFHLGKSSKVPKGCLSNDKLQIIKRKNRIPTGLPPNLTRSKKKAAVII